MSASLAALAAEPVVDVSLLAVVRSIYDSPGYSPLTRYPLRTRNTASPLAATPAGVGAKVLFEFGFSPLSC